MRPNLPDFSEKSEKFYFWELPVEEMVNGRIPWAFFLQRELYVPYIHGGEEMNLYLMYKHNLTFVLSLPIGSRVWRWKSYTFLLSFLVSIQSWSWWSPKPLPPEMLHDLRGDPKSPRHLANSKVWLPLSYINPKLLYSGDICLQKICPPQSHFYFIF